MPRVFIYQRAKPDMLQEESRSILHLNRGQSDKTILIAFLLMRSACFYRSAGNGSEYPLGRDHFSQHALRAFICVAEELK